MSHVGISPSVRLRNKLSFVVAVEMERFGTRSSMTCRSSRLPSSSAAFSGIVSSSTMAISWSPSSVSSLNLRSLALQIHNLTVVCDGQTFELRGAHFLYLED